MNALGAEAIHQLVVLLGQAEAQSGAAVATLSAPRAAAVDPLGVVEAHRDRGSRAGRAVGALVDERPAGRVPGVLLIHLRQELPDDREVHGVRRHRLEELR